MISKNRRIEWSLTAQQDLQQIHAWIARDSPKYALRMIRRIRQKVETVRRFPEGAAIIPEMNRHELRETFEGPYRILFEVNESRVLVLSIIHGARLLKHDDETEEEGD